MKTMLKISALTLCLSIFFIACKKELSYEVGTGGSDYFPRTANSSWTYQFDGDPLDTLQLYVNPATVTVSSKKYSVFMTHLNAPLDSFGYYRRSGSDYFSYADFGTLFGLDEPVWVEYIFLKDNLAVNDTWSSSTFTGKYTPQNGTTIDITLRFDFIIIQKDATVTVNGVDYPNTIEVKHEVKQINAGNPVLIGYYNNYYSKDKGLIKQELYDNQGVLQSSMDVIRIDVK